jgi:DNA-binding CsgD family transcriptional regulator
MHYLGRAMRPGPLLRLTLLAAVVGALTAGAVATWIESRVNDMMLAQVAARAKDQVQLGILANVRNTDFELPYSPEKRADLAARLDPLLARARQSDSGIIRLNIFARDGTILYSDLASLRGQTVSPLADERLARALAGIPGVDITSLDGLENSDLRARYGRALEAYIPFTLDGHIAGVYEFYEDLSSIEPIRPLVWSSVAAGSAVVLAVVLVAVLKTWQGLPLALELPTHRGPAVVAGGNGNGEATRAMGPPAPALLTRREIEVLRLMADGLTYPQIAAQLVVDEETVRSHAKGVLRKLGQSSRAEAVVAARRVGLLE